MTEFDNYLQQLQQIHGPAEPAARPPGGNDPEAIIEDHPIVSQEASLTFAKTERLYSDPKLILNPDRRSIKAVYIHQSLIKAMTDKGTRRDYCGTKLYVTAITGQMETRPTESMQKGLYFEAHLLNNGLGKDGKPVTLPLLKNGKKSSDHLRIDEQVFHCKNVVIPELGLLVSPELIWRQFMVEVEDEETRKAFPFKVYIELETDLISPISYKDFRHELAIIDWKLTIDRNGCFGDFCWGRPENMDHIQAWVYSFALKIPFFYVVVDYKARDRGWKLVPVNTYTDHPNPKVAEQALMRRKEMFQTIRTVVSEIEFNHLHGWKTNPLPENCRTCPLKDCPDRKSISIV